MMTSRKDSFARIMVAVLTAAFGLGFVYSVNYKLERGALVCAIGVAFCLISTVVLALGYVFRLWFSKRSGQPRRFQFTIGGLLALTAASALVALIVRHVGIVVFIVFGLMLLC